MRNCLIDLLLSSRLPIYRADALLDFLLSSLSIISSFISVGVFRFASTVSFSVLFFPSIITKSARKRPSFPLVQVITCHTVSCDQFEKLILSRFVYTFSFSIFALLFIVDDTSLHTFHFLFCFSSITFFESSVSSKEVGGRKRLKQNERKEGTWYTLCTSLPPSNVVLHSLKACSLSSLLFLFSTKGKKDWTRRPVFSFSDRLLPFQRHLVLPVNNSLPFFKEITCRIQDLVVMLHLLLLLFLLPFLLLSLMLVSLLLIRFRQRERIWRECSYRCLNPK